MKIEAAELTIDDPLESTATHLNRPESLSLSALVMCRLEPLWYLRVVFSTFFAEI